MESTYSDLDACFPEWTCDVERTGILVRLDPDEGHQPKLAVTSQTGEKARDGDSRVRLVDRLDIDGNLRPKNLPFRAIRGDAVNSRKRVRRDHRAPPPGHIAVVVVVRRLD